jgi:hypothetical protein
VHRPANHAGSGGDPRKPHGAVVALIGLVTLSCVRDRGIMSPLVSETGADRWTPVAHLARQEALPPLETVREFLLGHVADAESLDEVRARLRRIAQHSTRMHRRVLAGLEAVLAISWPSETLVRWSAGMATGFSTTHRTPAPLSFYGVLP